MSIGERLLTGVGRAPSSTYLSCPWFQPLEYYWSGCTIGRLSDKRRKAPQQPRTRKASDDNPKEGDDVTFNPSITAVSAVVALHFEFTRANRNSDHS